MDCHMSSSKVRAVPSAKLHDQLSVSRTFVVSTDSTSTYLPASEHQLQIRQASLPGIDMAWASSAAEHRNAVGSEMLPVLIASVKRAIIAAEFGIAKNGILKRP
jgi:hypothetical protein